MSQTIDLRRIAVFVILAFGIAWTGGLVIFLTGGLINSPRIGGGFMLAILVLTIVYMGAPAVAHILTSPTSLYGTVNSAIPGKRMLDQMVRLRSRRRMFRIWDSGMR